MEKYEVLTSVPFSLAYLDWCKTQKGIREFEDTGNHLLVMEFWKIYCESGGKVEPWEISAAKEVRKN